MPRQIAFLIYRDFQILDAAGPMAAFEIAERYRPGSYALRVVASTAGAVRSSAGISMLASSFGRGGRVDTLIVAGGDGSRAALACPRTRRYLQSCATGARRTASVCSGAYLLAAAGILDGKRATTHWSRSVDFAHRFPRVRLEPDRVFIKDGTIWSSAGISAGIDLSLALIEEDLGEAIARQTAQQLVVYFRRPGGQSQFSAMLEMQRANGRFATLLDYVRGNLGKRLSVPELADQAHMSARHFSRAFHAETGLSPARAIEQLRAEAARGALEGTGRSVQEIARSHGFGSTERMRRSFVKLFGVSPAAIRLRARTDSGKTAQEGR